MRHKGLIISLVFLGVVGIAFFLGVISYLLTGGSESAFFWKDRVAVIMVEGTLLSSEKLIEEIEEVRKDDSVASVVLRIESPGGSVGVAQEIREAVVNLAKEKPVVASMGAIATSGAYDVALGATRILANPGTITGSIGVRMEHLMLRDLFKWARVEHETLKSGKYKDIGSFDRPITEEERKILQDLLENLHQQFKQEVADARHLSLEEVDAVADGRIYTGKQAIQLGLIDAIGGYVEAIKVAGELGGISGEPELTYPQKRSKFFRSLMEDMAQSWDLLTRETIDYWRPVM